MNKCFFILCLVALLSGCYRDSKEISSFINSKERLPQNWWHVYGGILLDDLVQELMYQNWDVQKAYSKIKEAKGNLRLEKSVSFFHLNGIASANRTNKEMGVPRPISIHEGGFETNWEISLFKGNYHNWKGAWCYLNSVLADKEDVINTVITFLVNYCISYKQDYQKIKELNDLILLYDTHIDILEARLRAQYISEDELLVIKGYQNQAKQEKILAEARLRNTQYAMEELLGADRSEALNQFMLDHQPLSIPLLYSMDDVPLHIIKNRPDVKGAFWHLLASKEYVKAKEQDFWPNITLKTFFGWQKGDKELLLVSPMWSLASSLGVPLFNFGQLKASLQIADAQSEEAFYSYEKTVITALKEAQTALNDYASSYKNYQEEKENLSLIESKLALENERYLAGLIDQIPLQEVSIQKQRIVLHLVDREAEIRQAYLRWQKALGCSLLTSSYPKSLEKIISYS
ncbi:MAG: TolC family protein [Rhabdochlamydiaceae bacterium]